MLKINLHGFKIHDLNFFDVCYDIVNIIFHDDIQGVLQHDKINYPVLNRSTLLPNLAQVKEFLLNEKNKLIFMDLYEGNCTVTNFLNDFGLYKFFKNNQILVISSGNFSEGVFLNIDVFLSLVGENKYNQFVSLNNFDKIYTNVQKPYKFLFLNKRKDIYRENLISLLNNEHILQDALWSNLSADKNLPEKYNDYYNDAHKRPVINNTIYDDTWKDGTIVPELYVDTYFSVITETNFFIPTEYRTEKIYKPLLIGHPFIVVSGYGYYKGLHNMGFKTFDSLINERFDTILNDSDRLITIKNVIVNLCKTNLGQFLKEAKPICEYNRQRYLELLGVDNLTKYNLFAEFFDKINYE